MTRLLKLTAIGLAAVAALAMLALVLGGQLAERKRMRQINLQVDPVAPGTDTASLQLGRYLFMSRGCAECHGAAGGGREFMNDGKGMRMAGPNITRGGVTAAYQPVDWVRTIRHGVKPDGRPLFIMPSEDYNRLTNPDLAALVGFVQNLPALTGGPTVIEAPLPVMALYGFGGIRDAAEKIDHSLPPSIPITVAVTPEYGAYVANSCIGCHGPGLSGGTIPGAPPDWPAAANLTPGEGGIMPRYPNAASFAAMLRSGQRPGGTSIRVMPFAALRELNQTDVQALYMYLGTLPPRPLGHR